MLHRLVRIFVLPRSLEDVAAVDFLAAQIAGLARHAAQLVEPVVVRLELVVGDAQSWIVMSSGIDLGAVALDDVAAAEMVARQVAPVQAAPVIAGAADAVAGQERAQAAHRQRGLRPDGGGT